MENKHILFLVIGLTVLTVFLVLFLVFCYCKRSTSQEEVESEDREAAKLEYKERDGVDTEELIKFPGGEQLNINDILEAPGEVIAKSSYGTLYKASLMRTNSLALLRFLRPACTLRIKEVMPVIEFLGSVSHPNLVPLLAFYAGPRGEKLLVHPFYAYGTLAQFIRDSLYITMSLIHTDGNAEAHKWLTIRRISIGIARALGHLHTALQMPIIHGNLKSKNILLDQHCEPYVSDFGLHLLLNSTAGQQMLETSAAQGYKAPELIKRKDVSEECDIYSLGVIFLELLTGRGPINDNPIPGQDCHLPNAMRTAILDHRFVDLCHPDILLDQRSATEDCLLLYFQLAVACCSLAPSLRPDIKQVLGKLEEIGR